MPVRKFITQSIHASTSTRNQHVERRAPGRGEAVGLEEQREDPVGLVASEDGPGMRASSRWSAAGVENASPSVCCNWSPIEITTSVIRVVLGREVVHDGAVVDAEPLGDASERELAEPVVDRGGERAVEDLVLGVSVTHLGLDCSDRYE